MTNFWCGRFYYTLCTSNLGMWRAACVSRSPMSVATRTMIYIYCWLLWQIASFTRVLIQNHQPTFYDHKTELYAEALRMANLRILISSRSGPTGRLRSHLSQNGGESESESESSDSPLIVQLKGGFAITACLVTPLPLTTFPYFYICISKPIILIILITDQGILVTGDKLMRTVTMCHECASKVSRTPKTLQKYLER